MTDLVDALMEETWQKPVISLPHVSMTDATISRCLDGRVRQKLVISLPHTLMTDATISVALVNVSTEGTRQKPVISLRHASMNDAIIFLAVVMP